MKSIRFKELFAYKEFDKYWIASSFAIGASNIFQYILSFYILKETGSPFQFAISISIGAIPRLLLTPFAGVFGDRYPKVKVMSSLNLLTVIVMLMFTYWISLQGTLTMPMVYSIVLFLEIIEIFYGACEEAIIPELLEEEYLADAASFCMLDNGIVSAICPFLSAYLYQSVKLETIFLMIVGLLFFAFLWMVRVKTPFATRTFEAKKVTWRDNVEDVKLGYLYVKDRKHIKTLIEVLPMISFTEAAVFNVLMTYILLEVFGISPYAFSVYSSITVGMLVIAPFFVDRIIKKYPIEKIIAVSMLVTTAGLVVLGFTVLFALKDLAHIFFYVGIVLFVDCLSLFITLAVRSSNMVYMQTHVEEMYRSRVMSTGMMLRIVAASFGGILYGFLAEKIGVSYTVWIGSACIFASYLYMKKQFKNENPVT